MISSALLVSFTINGQSNAKNSLTNEKTRHFAVGSFITINSEETVSQVKYAEENYQTSDGGQGTLLRYINKESKSYFSPEIKVKPNPSDGKFTVILPDTRSEVIIYDLLGNIINQQNATSVNHQIDISSLPKGIYFVKVISGDIVYKGKIVTQ